MRLIDADTLVEFLLKEIIECDKEYDDKSDHIILGAGQEAELIRDKVKEMPTVDIVQCKDCKKWDAELGCCTSYAIVKCTDGREGVESKADDFCSRCVKK